MIQFTHQANARDKTFCNQKKNLMEITLLKDKIISIEKVS
jgi:hypothetical protein